MARRLRALGLVYLFTLSMTACTVTSTSSHSSAAHLPASSASRTRRKVLSPLAYARAVRTYVIAHSNVGVGLPPAIALPTTSPWLFATVSVPRLSSPYGAAGYSVTYYATRRPYPMATAPYPAIPPRAVMLLQMTGQRLGHLPPRNPLRRLDYLWRFLGLGPAPGELGVGTGDPVPLPLATGLRAVEYRTWGDTVQWVQGSWTIVFEGAGARSGGLQAVHEVSQLLSQAPLPSFTGVVAIVFATPYQATMPTLQTDLVFVRDGDLYTLMDLGFPAEQIFHMVRILPWSRSQG